ncbi:MAG: hypothetical protein MI861_13320, partial [Pirellulales bacterium]|nr:hypothetical protein [Pirellulales bacterium]
MRISEFMTDGAHSADQTTQVVAALQALYTSSQFRALDLEGRQLTKNSIDMSTIVGADGSTT